MEYKTLDRLTKAKKKSAHENIVVLEQDPDGAVAVVYTMVEYVIGPGKEVAEEKMLVH